MSETTTTTTTITCEREDTLGESTSDDNVNDIAPTVVNEASSARESISTASLSTSDDTLEAKDYQTMMAVLLPTAFLTMFTVAFVAGSHVSGQMEDTARELEEPSLAKMSLEEEAKTPDEGTSSRAAHGAD
ncbi:hypothetical protein CERZMDRAFT_101353 [Cercospora zeae-maydis SCOH1-5]|uniref:Uncharacterized protein n=1 Tax=Cercospora zeae-maydis SCOH1-5 TaxID=717836 RepID=A0A6A6F3V5_9PEZI|nr:hypothetical protein CERZMDRAFT_101353 [Cercospora zeae-maydis SCOH1-5]